MCNSSSTTEFLLLAFADTRQLQLLHFWLFLGIYLAALLGNGLIITTVACDHRLHTPMYFFLLNLSLLDLGSISTTVPKSMANSLWDSRAISYWECAAQVFFFVFFITLEYSVLTIMAYDRYVAICQPLHYGTLLGSRACVHMAAAAWGSGFLYTLLHTANTFSLPLCKGNAVDQFFCEIPQILKLSCSCSYLREVGLLVLSACLVFRCFVFILFSYVQIFRVVLRIPSEQGRHKAFSTCLPHLAVVSLFIGTAVFAYLKPSSTSSPSLDLVVAVLYSVVPPAVNPLLYSMRNQEIKDALWNMMNSNLTDLWQAGRYRDVIKRITNPRETQMTPHAVERGRCCEENQNTTSDWSNFTFNANLQGRWRVFRPCRHSAEGPGCCWPSLLMAPLLPNVTQRSAEPFLQSCYLPRQSLPYVISEHSSTLGTGFWMNLYWTA
ncbi:olfactory receptor 14J1-like [Morphnus guianensis]